MISEELPTVSATQAQDLLSQGWTLLDVRTHDEWDSVHVPGAVHLPMDEVVARLEQVGNQIVCLCAVGGRSARVTAYLNAQGRDAVNLDGGIQAWAAAGLPVETASA